MVHFVGLARARGPLRCAIVWDIWRDYNQWPAYEDAMRRIKTWLDIEPDLASSHVFAVERIGIVGLKCESPIHVGKRQTGQLGTWR